jgi:hypothetical protein
MPVPKERAKADRVAGALKRLKIKPQLVANAPQITSLFKNAHGGLKAVLAAMRFFGQDEVIARFLKKYDAIPVGDRERIPWEAVALAAHLNIHHLIGSTMCALQAVSANTVKILAVTNQHKVTRARIKFAQLPSGERDRTALDTAYGFLPSPKGNMFIGKAVFGPQNGKEAPEPVAPTFGQDDDLEQLFPPSNLMQEALVPVRQRLLEG